MTTYIITSFLFYYQEKIAKGDMRMCVVVPKPEGSSGYDLSSYHHVGCFRLPRKFQTGSTKLTPEEFVSDYVEAPDDILPGKLDEIVQLLIGNTSGDSAKKKKKADDDNTNAEEDTTIMGQLKAAYQEQQKKGGEPKSKKVKRDETFEKMLDLYTLHCKTKADSLKDFLRYVRGYLVVVVVVVVTKCGSAMVVLHYLDVIPREDS
jgi:hypothetical protein